MNSENIHILLAEDDEEDRFFFQEALKELQTPVQLTMVYNGEQLMELVSQEPPPAFDVLFLDLNMPRINGMACLAKIKKSDVLRKMPVIIFSSAGDPDVINQVYKDAAHYYIQKPTEISEIRKVIHKALLLLAKYNNTVPLRDNFLLS